MKTSLKTFPEYTHENWQNMKIKKWKEDFEAELRKRLEQNRLIRDNGTQPHLRIPPITVQLDLISIKEILGEEYISR